MAEPLTIKGAPEVMAKLRRVETQMPGATLIALDQAARYLKAWMQAHMLAGQRLRAPTGHLSGSWHVRPYATNAVVLATPCRYARVHEYGFRGVVYVHEYPRKPARKRKAGRARKGGRAPGAKKYDVKRQSPSYRRVGGISNKRMDLKGGASAAMRDKAFKDKTAKLWSSRTKSKPKHRKYGPVTIIVRAHNRRMNLRARYYLRDTVRSQRQIAFQKGLAHVQRLVANA